jgi:hypothetical protein
MRVVPRSAVARAAAAPLAVLLIAATVTGVYAQTRPGPSAGPAGHDPSVWGWATARKPTAKEYSPAAKDRGSWNGGAVTVSRVFEGYYQVFFHDFMPVGSPPTGKWGTVRATALSPVQRTCQVGGWSIALPTKGPPEDLYIQVDCRDRTGQRVDTAFTASYLQAREHIGQIAYLWADDPSEPAEYATDPDWTYNSASPVGATVDRTATGRYTVALPNLQAGTSGNLQVVSVQAEGSCRLVARRDIGSSSEIDVHCLEFAGDPLDATFFMSFTDDVSISTAEPGAYLFANSPTRASYQPKAIFRYSTAGMTPTVTRSGTGDYRATLPGMPEGGVAHVTAYGDGKSGCQLESIRKSALPQRIGVLCDKPNGDPVDSKFYLTYTK